MSVCNSRHGPEIVKKSPGLCLSGEIQTEFVPMKVDVNTHTLKGGRRYSNDRPSFSFSLG